MKTLGPGQSYTQQLSLQDVGPAPASLLSSLTANFSPGSFSGGATVRLEAFANSLTDTPIAQTFTVSQSPDPGASTGLSLLLPTDPPFFGDLQGIARVTMVSGDAQLSGLSVDQVISGEWYSESILVPEPSGFGLAVLSMGCLVLLRARRAPLALGLSRQAVGRGNIAAAGKPGVPPVLACERHRSGLPEPGRSAAGT